MVVIPLCLGGWQLQRLQWKTELLETLDQKSKTPPVKLSETPQEYELVLVEGEFLKGPYLEVLAPRRGNPKATKSFGTFKTQSGRLILIQIGTPPPYQVRFPKKPGLFTPENTPSNTYYIDLEELKARFKVELETEFYLANPTDLPPLPNNHLGYALVWFSLSLIGVYIFYLSKKRAILNPS